MTLMRPFWRGRIIVAPPPPGGRLRGLDLLRAIAVLVVVLHHTWSNAVPAVLIPVHQFGWMGVDLFFVLSGYLIGYQLFRRYSIGQKPSLADFYASRGLQDPASIPDDPDSILPDTGVPGAIRDGAALEVPDFYDKSGLRSV